MSAIQAAKEFKDLTDLSEKGNLVSSYTFLHTERVVFVTDVWYAMDVKFKKSFLANVAMLQDAISGQHYFEVRHDHSNETVALVTAFGGSLQVYKQTRQGRGVPSLYPHSPIHEYFISDL